MNFAIHGMKYGQAPNANVPDLAILVDLLRVHHEQHGIRLTDVVAGAIRARVDHSGLRLRDFRPRDGCDRQFAVLSTLYLHRSRERIVSSDSSARNVERGRNYSRPDAGSVIRQCGSLPGSGF